MVCIHLRCWRGYFDWSFEFTIAEILYASQRRQWPFVCSWTIFQYSARSTIFIKSCGGSFRAPHSLYACYECNILDLRSLSLFWVVYPVMSLYLLICNNIFLPATHRNSTIVVCSTIYAYRNYFAETISFIRLNQNWNKNSISLWYEKKENIFHWIVLQFSSCVHSFCLHFLNDCIRFILLLCMRFK